VTEERKEQQIEGFEIIGSQSCGDARPNATERRPAGVEATTPPPVTAIVFEELGPEARAAAFRAGEVFIRERRLDGEFVGIFTLDSNIHTIVPYTSDRAALLGGIREAAMRPGCPQRVTGVVTSADGGESCAGDIGEAKVKATVAGLQAVVRTLAPLPGRKNILLFSEGFRVSTAESAADRLEGLIAAANQRGITFHAIDAVGLRTIDGRQAVRQRLSSYTGGRDAPGVLTPGKEDANALLALDPTAALARLADGTGGELVEDTNDLDAAVKQLTGEMHDYYRLSYRPTDQSSNRRYRHIVVKVSVPGAVVRARSGYYVDSERNRDVPVLQPSSVAPHLILDSGTTRHDFEMTTSLQRTGRDLEVRARVPAAGLTFRAADGRFEGAVTILARAIGQDKNVLAAASDSFVLSGPTDGLPAAHARTIQFAKVLSAKNARTIEIVAYDVVGQRASVERHDVNSFR
jgi:VWFA-related protein